MSASPGAVAALHRMNLEIDIRHVLPAVRTPMLVIHRAGDAIPVEGARYLATHIPGAEYLELPGNDHAPFVDPDSIVGPAAAFLRRVWAEGGWTEDPDRVLATCSSRTSSARRRARPRSATGRGAASSEEHHALVRAHLARHRGREVDTAGDGFFAAFDGLARAIRCASAISGGVRSLGLEVRAGLHTGECELVDGKVAGSRSRSAPALPLGPRPGRCSSRAQSATSSQARGSPSRNAGTRS